jgi:hypothetical protein
MKNLLCLALCVAAASVVSANQPTVSGDYLEVRSCDVFTGPCVANGEMGITGKEAILVWKVREGSWNNIALDGLSVIAVVRTDDTLGNVQYQPRNGTAILIVDAQATSLQREALKDLARTMGGSLVREVADVRSSAIESNLGSCAKAGCASVKAPGLVDISTRCFGAKDHLCGNEETFYPPLTEVAHAMPAFTEMAAYTGTGLNLTWEAVGQRSAFIASFSR